MPFIQRNSNATTAHSRFALPLGEGSAYTGLPVQSERARVLRQAALLVVDEVTMATKEALQRIDKTLQDIMKEENPACRDIPFGGKPVVLCGDWRQLTPVVPHGSRSTHNVAYRAL